MWSKFRFFKSHRPLNGFFEYSGWIKRFTLLKCKYQFDDQLKIRNLIKSDKIFFLFPLQLESDAQIYTHSPFSNNRQVIQKVLRSFAEYAPSDSELVIKNHPLSTGIPNHKKTVADIAFEYHIESRVIFLESGDLSPLLKETKGVIVVNSTSGTQALQQGKPVITLGKALFDMPGLTFQEGLDRFWKHATPPDKKLFNAYHNVLMHKTQINGDFYSDTGIALAVRNSLPKLGALPMHDNKSIKRTILITGASKGIGASLAYQYAKPGVRLILIARNLDALNYVKQQCEYLGAEVISKSIDVSHHQTLADAIILLDEQYPIDLLVTNAGVTLASGEEGQLEPLKKAQHLLEINLLGTLHVVNPMAERMRQRQNGQIAMVSSLAAYFGMPVNPIYSASKAAIKSYGEALRGLLKDQGVKVSVICPGFVETELSQQFPGKRPFMISSDKAARLITKGLNKNKAVIAFPMVLALGMKCLQLMPFPIASFFMGLSGFNRAKKGFIK